MYFVAITPSQVAGIYPIPDGACRSGGLGISKKFKPREVMDLPLGHGQQLRALL